MEEKRKTYMAEYWDTDGFLKTKYVVAASPREAKKALKESGFEISRIRVV